MTKKENNKRNNKKPVNSSQQKNNRRNTKPQAQHKKKADKPAYVAFVLAGIALVLLIFTVVHFIQNGDVPEETVTEKVSSETKDTGIDSNIYFAGISLGGMKFDEFEKEVSHKTPELLENIKLTFDNTKSDEAKNRLKGEDEQEETVLLKFNEETSLTAKELGVDLDLEKIYHNAEELTKLLKNNKSKGAALFYQVVYAGEKDKAEKPQLDDLATVENNQYNLLPVFRLDQEALQAGVDKLAEEVKIEPEIAEAVSFNLEKLEFEFDEGKVGYELKSEDLIKEIEKAFTENELDQSIKLEFNEVKADTSLPEDQEIGLISNAVTELVSHDPPRDANVARVAELLTGYIIQPGEEFSYWNNILPISLENGYFLGGQIGDDGQLEQVIGGGICQGSSTLYVAAVRADLEITERHNHTVPSAYVEKGMDAMVASWGADLRFVNNTDFPIAIVGNYIDATSVEFQLYGRKLPEGVAIDLDPYFVNEVAPGAPIRTPNSSLAPGEEVVKRNATTGSRWSTDKVYYKDGVEYDRVHLNESHYWAYQAKIEYGPEVPTAAPTTAPPTTAAPPTTSEATEAPTETTTTEAPTEPANPSEPVDPGEEG